MNQTKNTDASFGKLRSFFWPIHNNERKKLIPMLMMLFLICFSYSILRCMKDAVILTASGAEVIPFIKVWALLPMAVVLTFLFTILTNRYSQEQVFYIMTSGFLIYFVLFAFVLYPFREYLHPHDFADWLRNILPAGFRGMIAMVENWTITTFYVFAELWSTIVMTVMFWGFANEVTKVKEARRFYAVLAVASNIAAILAGQFGNFFAYGGFLNPELIRQGYDTWEKLQSLLIVAIVFAGVTAMAIFRWMNKNVLNDPSFDELHQSKISMNKKGKLSVKESFSYLSNSKYLICIAIIVISYNLVINLVEVVWKDQLKILYPSSRSLYIYMNNLTSLVGCFSTVVSFCIPMIIKRFGWTRIALVTPVIMAVTSLGFFSFLLFKDTFGPILMLLLGVSPISVVVFFGGAQNCLSKASKYSVFDATKEMSFIPLSHECKLKGKAAIDGVGSRFGKSGGSIIHQGLLMCFGTLSASAPIVATILSGVIVFWIYAARSLGRQFVELVASQEKEVSDIEPQAELSLQVAPASSK